MIFLKTTPIALVIAALLFASSRRIDVVAFWLYPLLMWMSAGLIYTLARRRHPELLRERLKPPNDRDRASQRISLPLMTAHYVVAGLDVDLFGDSAVPLALQIGGFCLVAIAMGFVGWTLLTNPFASSAVRIQNERGHAVISTGPYAIVRHPMYFGVYLFGAGSGLALGSWWSVLLLAPLWIVFARRTLLEDRMLHEELPGYAEYASKVRARIVPGVF
jgi:protein-S-isoprenylcysteine O-methyltransferase Ste14